MHIVWVPMRLLLPSFPLFLGKQLSKILNHLEENENEDLITVSDKQGLKLDILKYLNC